MRILLKVPSRYFQLFSNKIHLDHRGGAQPKNPFSEYFSKIAQSNPMVKKTMERGEALRIFNIEAAEKTEIDPQKVMEVISKSKTLFLKMKN